jgi:hypothetical protein
VAVILALPQRQPGEAVAIGNIRFPKNAAGRDPANPESLFGQFDRDRPYASASRSICRAPGSFHDISRCFSHHYYDFFASSLAALLHVPESSVVLQIILPVGVSFYTFASLSYTIDVYWGKMKAVRNFVDYALFIAFFPHLIAGPII